MRSAQKPTEADDNLLGVTPGVAKILKVSKTTQRDQNRKEEDVSSGHEQYSFPFRWKQSMRGFNYPQWLFLFWWQPPASLTDVDLRTWITNTLIGEYKYIML